jgi:hypothetical protein
VDGDLPVREDRGRAGLEQAAFQLERDRSQHVQRDVQVPQPALLSIAQS